MYPFNKNTKDARGFTLIEVLVAVAILAVGLMATAALLTRTLSDTVRARQMSLAALMASEKLEDLNRWPASDPHVWAPANGVAGSLVADTTANVVIGGVGTQINYYDDIIEGRTAGAYSETVSGVDPVTGAPVFTTTTHAPDGTITTTVSPQAPAPTFKRRWLIEMDQPVAGVRRVTVLVTSMDPTLRQPITFQMSMVRP